MSEIRLTGKGAPTRMTKGVIGQHYEDLNTGNIYECLVASEQSKLNGAIGGGYVWKLKYTGEDRRDHEAIFGAGNSVEMVEKVLYQNDNAEFSDEEGLGVYEHILEKPFDFAVGKTCIVEFDGVKYECEVKASGFDEEVKAIGNLDVLGTLANFDYEDTGEPFCVTMEHQTETIVMTRSTESTHSIKISTMEEKSSDGGGTNEIVVNATFTQGDSPETSLITFDRTFDECYDAFTLGKSVRVNGLGSYPLYVSTWTNDNAKGLGLRLLTYVYLGDNALTVIIYTWYKATSELEMEYRRIASESQGYPLSYPVA